MNRIVILLIAFVVLATAVEASFMKYMKVVPLSPSSNPKDLVVRVQSDPFSDLNDAIAYGNFSGTLTRSIV